MIVAEVRRRNPHLDGIEFVDEVKRERLRLGFTADELDGRKRSASQIHRAIDAYEHMHPRPRLVVSRYRPPAPAGPAEELFSVDEARRRGLWMHANMWTMPRAHAQPGVTIDADGTLTRLVRYHQAVKQYDLRPPRAGSSGRRRASWSSPAPAMAAQATRAG